ncbi:hypothetical protein ATORI0001_0684 [Lancefieldella rimae ATCC 49626]|uniref:Uncharacterized protein n=1 Tax=Lancefieldella rimae (strain ATCC 49626 / DSM 7090 / CCUG 31168 / NBRC 15546 / VPI D140H-11A) TaxID=553184 RepID=B9CKX2_LANR4|nr:hypothetical protein ATORI0001_0684 [Lancefieldella rimae ATCC 49626]
MLALIKAGFLLDVRHIAWRTFSFLLHLFFWREVLLASAYTEQRLSITQ